MGSAIWAALSGANVQQTTLDAAANNVANVTTPGYRADAAVFREYLRKAANASRRTSPAAEAMRFSAAEPVGVSQTRGEYVHTGRPMDVAIRDDGWFVVRTAQGERYTRVGETQVTKDGTLVTRNGDPYLGRDRKPIRVTPGAAVTLGTDGTVSAAGATSGQLLLVTFPTTAGLEREGATLFRATAQAGQPRPSASLLEPGSLEMSNVPAVKGMIDIVNATRGFEACERVIEAFSEAERRAAMSLMGRD